MRRLVLVLLVVAPPAALAQADVEPQPAARPIGPPPSEPPPPPDATGSLPQPPPAAPAGQWVYTNEYGWLFIPYAREYTYVPPDPRVFPDQYVYYPVYGWRWVVAPWVYGYGPAPYWGALGPRHFIWYVRPWFRVGGYWGWGAYHGWGPYRGWIGPRVWGSRGWGGAPAYYRSGIGPPHPHPVVRTPPRRVERERARNERRPHER